MKSLLWLGLLFLIFLTACQPATPPITQTPQVSEPDTSPVIPPATTATSLPQEPQPTAPTPGSDGYPAPTAQATVPPAKVPTGYPEPNEEVSWEQAKTLILEGQVAEATQFHSMKVILVLKDGRVVSTYEPAIDEVLAVIEQCADICSDIIVATE
ncbi:MAG TPA: hypothetical protein VJ436_10795 [Anaerolineales bacterium]|nr:hypothetical protein [Anaerolineales bacterium]